MQVFFSKEWLTLVESSFRNFLAEAIQHLPPPALLRFDTDRLQRSALQKQVDSLQTENAGLRQQLTASSTAQNSQAAAAPAHHNSQHRQQAKGSATSEVAATSTRSHAQHHRQLQQQPQQQQLVRVVPQQQAGGAAVAASPHQHSQEAELDSQQGPASETSQWVLADGPQQEPPSALQEAASFEDAETGDSQQALSLSSADLQPTWSASLSSMGAGVLAENSTGNPSQVNGGGDDTLSLDTETSSPRMIRQEAEPHAELSHTQLDAATDQLSSSQLQDQHLPSSSSQQPATPIQQSGLSEQLHQSAAHNNRSVRGSDSAWESASLPRSSDASMDSSTTAEQLASHEQSITFCSFSPNGQNLATASSDGVVRISAPTSLQVRLDRKYACE